MFNTKKYTTIALLAFTMIFATLVFIIAGKAHANPIDPCLDRPDEDTGEEFPPCEEPEPETQVQRLCLNDDEVILVTFTLIDEEWVKTGEEVLPEDLNECGPMEHEVELIPPRMVQAECINATQVNFKLQEWQKGRWVVIKEEIRNAYPKDNCRAQFPAVSAQPAPSQHVSTPAPVTVSVPTAVDAGI
jgi:hypothetical protein